VSRRITLITLVTILTVAFAACGESNKVGDESTLNFQEQANNRLGATPTTAAPASTKSSSPATRP
jgi:hypothetical protein